MLLILLAMLPYRGYHPPPPHAPGTRSVFRNNILTNLFNITFKNPRFTLLKRRGGGNPNKIISYPPGEITYTDPPSNVLNYP